MDKFDIEIQEGYFTIEPQDNGTYRILKEQEKIGLVYAEPIEEGMQWRTMDELDDSFVFALGEAIAQHNKNLL